MKYFLLVLLGWSNLVGAQIPDSTRQRVEADTIRRTAVAPARRTDAGIILHLVGHNLTQPARWTRKEWAIFGGVAVAWAGAYAVDRPVQEFWHNHPSPFQDRVLEPFGDHYSRPLYWSSICVATYTLGKLTDNAKIHETGLLLLASGFTLGLIQIPVRTVAGRARPYLTNDPHDFQLLGGWPSERSSFVSGHSAIAVNMATILAHQIKRPWATVVLYSLAAVTPWSRVYGKDHWLSDALVGSALGYVVARSTLRTYENRKAGLASRLQLIPLPTGLRLTYHL